VNIHIPRVAGWYKAHLEMRQVYDNILKGKTMDTSIKIKREEALKLELKGLPTDVSPNKITSELLENWITVRVVESIEKVGII
jgi:hypothetical protein